MVCTCLDVCNLRVPKASCIFTELIIRQSLLEGPWASLDVVFKTQVNGIRTVSKKKTKNIPHHYEYIYPCYIHTCFMNMLYSPTSPVLFCLQSCALLLRLLWISEMPFGIYWFYWCLADAFAYKEIYLEWDLFFSSIKKSRQTLGDSWFILFLHLTVLVNQQ